jgi:hypothetical protein
MHVAWKDVNLKNEKNNQQMHYTYLFNFYSVFPRHVSA